MSVLLVVRKWLLPVSGLLYLLSLAPTAFAATEPAGDYPIADRYAATVIGTPKAYKAPLPADIPVKEYSLPSIHEVPDLFWYSEGLRFSVALQEKRAPLIFNIGGTGAGYNSSKMVALQKALYAAGFHVINLSSPTHLNFLINASTSHMPGYLPEDAVDLYRVMGQAYAKVKDRIEVSDFHTMGYSLGAAHAAFVTHLDQTRKEIGLKRVYMINPPVSLYNSVTILDELLNEHIPGGLQGAAAFLNRTFDRLAAVYQPKAGMRFDGDFLYNAYNTLDESERGIDENGRSGAAALIGIGFRLTSAGMVFASDLMTRSGYIIPKDKTFGRREPLTYYAKASHEIRFVDYVNDMMLPYLKDKYPGKTRAQFLRAASLHHIADFLASYPDIRLVTNRDEVILAEGELEYMENLLGERMKVFGYGGHCGNIDSKENVTDMIAFLRGTEQ